MKVEYDNRGLYTQETIEALKKEFPNGTMVKLIKMNEEPHPVPPGTIGIVTGVDAGGVLICWLGRSSSLKLCPEIDKCEIISRPR